MDTKVTTKEQISALADGELGTEEITIALAALRESQDERDAWAMYHQIGDVLRSEDMDVSLSAGFSARMSALLDAEPTIIAPQPKAAVADAVAAPVAVAAQAANGDHRAARARPARLSRFALPGAAAAAAIVAAVFVATPQQAVVTASAPVAATPAQVAVVNVPSAISTVSAVSTMPGGAANGGSDVSGAQNVTQLSTLAQQGEVKRDPRIDDYLFAHQRFSPSYSSAQYARSAAFSVPADK